MYSTLNYDLLFEAAALRLGLKTIYEDRKNRGCARFLKIHGSSNFWPDCSATMFQGCTFTEGVKADVSIRIRPLNQEETIRRCLTDDSLAPARSIYAQGKAVRITPTYVENQRSMWLRSVNRARKIFVTGVRVHPADQHIWGPLGQCKADFLYFGFPSDREEFLSWKDEARKGNAFFHEVDFSHCISIIRRQRNRV